MHASENDHGELEMLKRVGDQEIHADTRFCLLLSCKYTQIHADTRPIPEYVFFHGMLSHDKAETTQSRLDSRVY